METKIRRPVKLSVARPGIAALVTALMFLALLSVVDASAQRRRKAVRPLPSPTVVPQGEPAVISRAADFPEDDSPVLLPKEPAEGGGRDNGDAIRDLGDRIRRLESSDTDRYDAKQKRLLLNLDILTKAEQRAESLRRQRFELAEKENALRTRIDQIDADSRPEMIERSVALSGSMRPEEIREARRKSLEAEKRNLQVLLTDIQSTRATMEQSVQRADALVDRLRTKLEKDIEAALADDPPDERTP
jgi:hypothetical protein